MNIVRTAKRQKLQYLGSLMRNEKYIMYIQPIEIHNIRQNTRKDKLGREDRLFG